METSVIVAILVGSIVLIAFIFFIIASEKSKSKSTSTVFKDAKLKTRRKKNKKVENKQIRPEIIRTSDKLQEDEFEFENSNVDNKQVNNQTKNMFISEQTNFEKINPEFDRVVSLDEINGEDKIQELDNEDNDFMAREELPLKDQINNLSPTMKALIVSDILDNDNF